MKKYVYKRQKLFVESYYYKSNSTHTAKNRFQSGSNYRNIKKRTTVNSNSCTQLIFVSELWDTLKYSKHITLNFSF